MRLLLARGARQELQNSRGWTAMHFAARWCHAGVVELLCAAPGATAALALQDKGGCTPLAVALMPWGFDATIQAACAAALRAHGAL